MAKTFGRGATSPMLAGPRRGTYILPQHELGASAQSSGLPNRHCPSQQIVEILARLWPRLLVAALPLTCLLAHTWQSFLTRKSFWSTSPILSFPHRHYLSQQMLEISARLCPRLLVVALPLACLLGPYAVNVFYPNMKFGAPAPSLATPTGLWPAKQMVEILSRVWPKLLVAALPLPCLLGPYLVNSFHTNIYSEHQPHPCHSLALPNRHCPLEPCLKSWPHCGPNFWSQRYLSHARWANTW